MAAPMTPAVMYGCAPHPAQPGAAGAVTHLAADDFAVGHHDGRVFCRRRSGVGCPESIGDRTGWGDNLVLAAAQALREELTVVVGGRPYDQLLALLDHDRDACLGDPVFVDDLAGQQAARSQRHVVGRANRLAGKDRLG